LFAIELMDPVPLTRQPGSFSAVDRPRKFGIDREIEWVRAADAGLQTLLERLFIVGTPWQEFEIVAAETATGDNETAAQPGAAAFLNGS
jgi:hypothetical protein